MFRYIFGMMTVLLIASSETISLTWMIVGCLGGLMVMGWGVVDSFYRGDGDFE